MATLWEKMQSFLKPIFGIVVVAFLFIFIVGGLAKLAQNISPNSRLANLFGGISVKKEVISVRIDPASVESGKSFSLSWVHENRAKEGIYELTYPCRTNIALVLSTGEPIPCNSAFSMSGREAVTIIPELKDTAPLDLPISITFSEKNSLQASLSGTASVTVIPAEEKKKDNPVADKGKEKPPAPSGGGLKPGDSSTKNYPRTGTPPASSGKINPNGVPDLAIVIVDTGIVIPASSTTPEQFKHADSVKEGERAAIVFDVKNMGSNVSGPWDFRAILPINDGDFRSEKQESINPGEKIRYTLGFEQLKTSGANTVKILVDPDGRIFNDANRLNNEVTLSITRGY